ncbi:MAG: multicopper oxidase domain-containing protein [Gemmatimonadaceae bacterium]
MKIVLAALALLLPTRPRAVADDPAGLARVAINDNSSAAGSLTGSTLTVELTVGRAQWFPEAEDGPSVEALAFGEVGKELTIPGPMIRVAAGTRVRVTVSNPLTDTLTIRGLHTRPGEARPVVIAPGERQEVEFSATPGTYFYWGSNSGAALGGRGADESQLSGAIVVDPPGAKRRDRVFILGIRLQLPDSTAAGKTPFHEAMVINGKSWPHTERLNLTQGDSVFWRVLNPTGAPHPMHLHGFYFRVDSRGNWRADTVFTHGQQRPAVTELMYAGSTYTMAFLPTEPGNWAFHCHFAFHVSPDRSLGSMDADTGAHAHGAKGHMSGLVLGMIVAPRGRQVVNRATPRDVNLFVNSTPRVFRDKPAYSFVLQNGLVEPAADSGRPPGEPLLLTRGERVRIRVSNRLSEPTAIHWHGIELESFPDGIPDWSGTMKNLFTNVPANGTFDAVFTPPRAGTFIYHSHLNEMYQIMSGMFGPLIVLEPGQKWDPEHDKIFLVGPAGPINEGENDMGTVNGEREPEAIDLVAGRTYRFRMINIHPDWRVQFSLGTDTTVSTWRPIAKDGADLPESQRRARAAFLLTGPGETADFEFTPTEPGILVLSIRTRGAGWAIPQVLRVRPADRPRVTAVAEN